MVDCGKNGEGTFDAMSLRKSNERFVKGRAQPRLDRIVARVLRLVEVLCVPRTISEFIR